MCLVDILCSEGEHLSIKPNESNYEELLMYSNLLAASDYPRTRDPFVVEFNFQRVRHISPDD